MSQPDPLWQGLDRVGRLATLYIRLETIRTLERWPPLRPQTLLSVSPIDEGQKRAYIFAERAARRLMAVVEKYERIVNGWARLAGGYEAINRRAERLLIGGGAEIIPFPRQSENDNQRSTDMPLGTRTKSGFSNNHPAGGSLSRADHKNPGASKRVSVTATFTASDGKVTGSTNDFAAFVVGDDIQVRGVASNQGLFRITAIDGSNHAFLVLDPKPKDEGPIAASIRTP